MSQIINVAARLGDAHGNEMIALKTLESGQTRFSNAGALELVWAHLYRAELAVRINNLELAQSSLAAARSLNLTDNESVNVADEFTHATELVNQV